MVHHKTMPGDKLTIEQRKRQTLQAAKARANESYTHRGKLMEPKPVTLPKVRGLQ